MKPERKVFISGSLSFHDMSTPIRRSRPGGCARATIGHAAKPPIPAMNCRRLNGSRSPRKGEEWVWNVLAFPITLHTRATGVVLSARILERKTVL